MAQKWLELLTLLVQLIVVSATTPLVRNAWGITVYVKVTTTNVRAVSASLSQYVYEGFIEYCWRDDSLRANWGDNAKYDYEVGESSDYWTKFPSAGHTSYWTSGTPISGKTPYPLVTPNIKDQLAQSKNTPIWEVHYGTPKWNTDVEQDTTSTWVKGHHEVSVTVAQVQDLHNFPLDTQKIKFALENTNVEAKDMTFHMINGGESYVEPLNDPDGYTLVKTEVSYATSFDPDLHSIILIWSLKRIPDVFFNRFVLPLVLISCLILLLQFANTSARTMAAFTIIGTTTSFLFISSNSTPQLPYRTRLDNYFTFQFFLAFCIGVWNIYSTHNADRFKDNYIKFFSPREEKKEKEKDEDKGDKKKDEGPDPTKKFEVPKTWPAWIAKVIGMPQSVINVLGPKDNKIAVAVAKAVNDDKLTVSKSSDIELAGVPLGGGGGDEKKDKDKSDKDKGGPADLVALMQKLVDFHLDGKKEEKKKNKEKKDDEKKMMDMQLIYDVRTAISLVVAYCVCVSCIFLA